MRAAGAITGLLVLGMFVIPGTYGPKRQAVSGLRPAAEPSPGSRMATPAEREAGWAQLRGRVYDDAGRPLEGALVSLAGSGFWPARSVKTDAEGRFRWPGIPAGIYELRASRGRLVAPALEGLILDAGARRAFAFQLERGWTLAGQVTDAQTGRALRGAEVTVTTGVLGLHMRRVETDAGGRFEVPGVVGDEQSLYVEADGYVAAGPLQHRSDAGFMTVRLERAATIEGRVVDDRGQAIVGAVVRAFGEGHLREAARAGGDSLGVTAGPVPPISAAGSGALAFVRQTTTTRDGSFMLTSLRPGPYTLGASHDDYAPGESAELRVGHGATRSGVRIVLLAGAELAGSVVDDRGFGLEAIPVELRTPGERLPRMTVTASDGSFSFRGVRGEVEVTALPYDLPPARETLRIEDEALVTVELELSTRLYTMHGRVVDERGYGVSGALLTVSSSDPGTPLRRNAKTDSDGAFSVPALPSPPFELRAEHPAFSTTRLSEVEDTEDVEVVMSAGVTFVGEVLDDWTSDGLRGARVQLEGPVKQDATTRADGTFVLRRLPTGTYDVVISHAEYETQTRRVVLEPPRYVDRPQELETVRLAPGGAIEGEVVDANGDAVAGAEVTWGEPPRWKRSARADARGAFVLRGVPAGEAWLTARHAVAGESSAEESITVLPLETSPGAFIELPQALGE